MAGNSEFVARNGIIVYGVNSGSTSDQVVVLNPTTNKLETRTDAGTSGTSGSSGTSGLSTLLYGTSTTSITLPPTAYGIAITGTDLGTSPANVCSATPGVERFTSTGEIFTGLVLYTDSALTTPQTGFTYVANDNDGAIFNLNSVTGLIGTRTPFSC